MSSCSHSSSHSSHIGDVSCVRRVSRVPLRSLWLALTLLALALPGARPAQAESAAAPAEATLPLNEILRLYRERDEAEAQKKKEPRPPIAATLDRVDLQGRLLATALDLRAEIELNVLSGEEWVDLPLLRVGGNTHVSGLPRVQGGVLSVRDGQLRFLSKRVGRYHFEVSMVERAQEDELGHRIALEHGGATLARLRVHYDPSLFRLLGEDHLRDSEGALIFAEDNVFSLAWQTLAEPQTRPTAKAPAAEPVITRAHAASVSTLEGERITRVLYELELTGRQRIELELAEGERVERAYLNGLPVPIEDRDGRLALEVAPSQAGKEAATLELVIGASGLDFTLSGELGFRLPRTSWPINELFLDVYLPQVFHYTWRGGSLSPVESGPPARFSHRVPVPGSRHSFHQFLVTRSAPDLTLSYAVNLEGHYYRGED